MFPRRNKDFTFYLRRLKKRAADKMKKEIAEKFAGCSICEYCEDYDYEENDVSEYRPIGDIKDIFDIIDKYTKA